MYAAYDFYTDTYGGTQLTQSAYTLWAMRAAQRLDADTAYRARSAAAANEDTALAVQLCSCAVAEALYEANLQKQNGGDIAAESVGTWSRTYAGKKDTHPVAAAEALYLAHTGLLYRGRCIA